MTELRTQNFKPFEGCLPEVLHGLEVLGGQLPAYMSVAALARRAGNPLTLYDIRQEFCAMNPDGPEEMLPSVPVIARGIEKLRRLQAVETFRTDKVGLPSESRLTDWGTEYILPLAGVVLGEQVASPRLSQQKLWGLPAFQGLSRVQNSRFGVVRILDAYPEGISNKDVQLAIGKNYAAAQKELDFLKKSGVVHLEKRTRQIAFSAPVGAGGFHRTEMTHILIDTIHRIYDGDGERVVLPQDVFLCQIKRRYPGVTLKQLRETLTFSDRTNRLPFISYLNDFPSNQKHIATLVLRWRQTVSVLVDGIVGLSEPKKRRTFAKRALALADTSANIASLLETNRMNAQKKKEKLARV